jgi:hypothetical protein
MAEGWRDRPVRSGHRCRRRLTAGATHPSWHRGAAITAYAIITLEIGWFLLTRMLVQDHP